MIYLFSKYDDVCFWDTFGEGVFVFLQKSVGMDRVFTICFLDFVHQEPEFGGNPGKRDLGFENTVIVVKFRATFCRNGEVSSWRIIILHIYEVFCVVLLVTLHFLGYVFAR